MGIPGSDFDDPPASPGGGSGAADDLSEAQARDLEAAIEAAIAKELAAAEQADALASELAMQAAAAGAQAPTVVAANSAEIAIDPGAIAPALDDAMAFDPSQQAHSADFLQTQMLPDEYRERLAVSISEQIQHAAEPQAWAGAASPAVVAAADSAGELAVASRTVPARLLEYDRGQFIALPVHTTIEVMETPEVIAVPGAAPYAMGMVRWQGRFLPLLDLRALLFGEPAQSAQTYPYILVLAYQSAPKEPVQHGMLAALSLPQTIQVGDNMTCAMPEDNAWWPHLALSCFTRQGAPVPIVDTGRLFSFYWG